MAKPKILEKIDKINKMKKPIVIIFDEVTDTIVCNPSKYDLMKVRTKQQKWQNNKNGENNDNNR